MRTPFCLVVKKLRIKRVLQYKEGCEIIKKEKEKRKGSVEIISPCERCYCLYSSESERLKIMSAALFDTFEHALNVCSTHH